MSIFDIFKSNEIKIREYTQKKNHLINEVKFNTSISGLSRYEYEQMMNNALKSNSSFEQYVWYLEQELNKTQLLGFLIEKFEDLKRNYNADIKIVEYIDNYKNKFTSLQQLQNVELVINYLISQINCYRQIKEKIMISQETVGVELNQNIKSIRVDELEELCNSFITMSITGENLLSLVTEELEKAQKIFYVNMEFDKVKTQFDSEEVEDYIEKSKNKINNINQIIPENISQLIDITFENITTYYEYKQTLEDISNKIRIFNRVENKKFLITSLINSNKMILCDDFKNKYNYIIDETKFVLNYIQMVDTLKNIFENNFQLSVFTNDFSKEISNKWLNRFDTLRYSEFTNDYFLEYKNDEEILNEYIYVGSQYEEFKSYVIKEISELRLKIEVNKFFDRLLIDELRKFENELRYVVDLYKSQVVETIQILEKLKKITLNIQNFNTEFNQIKNPLFNTLNMLEIDKPQEIEDIQNYYMYSIIKSLEKKLSIYGSSKHITDIEVQEMISRVEKNLYELTECQKKAFIGAVELLNRSANASCLIQGDVSSGKTIVTVMLMFLMAQKKYKSCYIVPRKILRQQHLGTLKKYNKLLGFDFVIHDAKDDFDMEKVDILLNGYSFSSSKFDLLTLDMAVIDEIQLFGVEQRSQIQKKYPNLDVFYTTATPHPRTKLISLIGNMDILEIRSLPPGRKPKITTTFTKLDNNHIDLIRNEVKKGQMILVVSPLVKSRGSNEFENVKLAFDQYSSMFPELRVELLLTEYSDEKKDNIILRAVSGEVDILVATKSIEVGVDIPNASTMIIHYPYTQKIKWGVSQLHQLRGRVGRKNQDSYCLIEAPSEMPENSPIESVLRTQDVFELTQSDFNWRGFEKIIGTKQSGTSGTKKDQEKRILAYEMLAKNTPKMLEQLDVEIINKLETLISRERIEDIN